MAEQMMTPEPRTTIGRPTLCSPETVHKILSAIATGSHWKPACEAAGVDYTTVRGWVEKADRDRLAGLTESPYLYFVERLKRAEAEAEVELAKVVAGTSDDWRAQAFILERRYRDRWGKQDAPSVAVQVVVSDALASQLADAMRVVAAKPLVLETTAEPQPEQSSDE